MAVLSPNARTKRHYIKQAGERSKTHTRRYFFIQHIADVWDSMPECWECQKCAWVPKAIITCIIRRKNTLRAPNMKTPFQLGNSSSHRSLEARKLVLFFIVVNSPCSKTLGRYMLLATTGNRVVSPTVPFYNALGGLVFNFHVA